MIELLTEAVLDCLKMLPFLFAAFLVIEALEHYSTAFTERVLVKVGKAGPVAGALAGCVPQCGFSVMAANLYAGGVISVGTLLSVFMATSDEAVLIILGDPEHGKEVLGLLGVKVVLGILTGYMVDLGIGKYIAVPKESGNLCTDCGCHEHHGGVLRPTLRHTVEIFVYLLVFTIILNIGIAFVGIESLSEYLLGDTVFQPVIAAAIGLIPNCAASVVLTQLYLSGVISFASVIAGLCSGAGIGLVVLFRVNKDRKENVKILGMLYVSAAAAGLIIQCIGG